MKSQSYVKSQKHYGKRTHKCGISRKMGKIALNIYFLKKKKTPLLVHGTIHGTNWFPELKSYHLALCLVFYPPPRYIQGMCYVCLFDVFSADKERNNELYVCMFVCLQYPTGIPVAIPVTAGIEL